MSSPKPSVLKGAIIKNARQLDQHVENFLAPQSRTKKSSHVATQNLQHAINQLKAQIIEATPRDSASRRTLRRSYRTTKRAARAVRRKIKQ